MLVKPGRGRPLKVFRKRITTERHKIRTLECVVAPNSTRDLVAIDSGQADVTDNDIRSKLFCQCEAMQAIIGHLYGMPFEFQ